MDQQPARKRLRLSSEVGQATSSSQLLPPLIPPRTVEEQALVHKCVSTIHRTLMSTAVGSTQVVVQKVGALWTSLVWSRMPGVTGPRYNFAVSEGTGFQTGGGLANLSAYVFLSATWSPCQVLANPTPCQSSSNRVAFLNYECHCAQEAPEGVGVVAEGAPVAVASCDEDTLPLDGGQVGTVVMLMPFEAHWSECWEFLGHL